MEKTNKIIDKILQEKIVPKPKWHFTVAASITNSLFAISVLLGAVAFSVILFAIQQTDFNLTQHLLHSKLEMFLTILPFVWLITLSIFFLSAYVGLSYSGKSYKAKNVNKVLLSTGLSIIIGTIIFLGGGAQKIEKAFELSFQQYESIEERKIGVWSRAKEGFLSGTIQSVTEDEIRLIDFKGETWTIEFSEAFVAPVVLLERGEKIKMIGSQSHKLNFKAREIRPWGGFNQMK